MGGFQGPRCFKPRRKGQPLHAYSRFAHGVMHTSFALTAPLRRLHWITQ